MPSEVDGTADVAVTKETEFFGTPWDPKAREIMIRQSPLTYADRVKAPTLFVHALTEKLFTFALGRGVEHHDMPVIRRIVADAAVEGYSFESIVLGVAQSVPFRMRSAAAPEGG